jgi:hypothetical protein
MSTAETEALTMRISRLKDSATQTAAEIGSIRQSVIAAAVTDSQMFPISSAVDTKKMSRQYLKTSPSQDLKDNSLAPIASEPRVDGEGNYGSGIGRHAGRTASDIGSICVGKREFLADDVEPIYISPLVELLGNILNATKQAKRSGKFAARVRKGHEGSFTVKTRVANARDVLKLIAEHECADQDNTNTSTLRLSLDDSITTSYLMQ